MTGNRSSAASTTNPRPSQNAGVAELVASGAAPTWGYDSTAANPRPARSSQTASMRRFASPWPRSSAVVATQVMTAGSGESGRAGYRSRVR